MITKAVLLAGAIYLAIAIAMFLGQRAFMYFPDAGGRIEPASVGLTGVEELTIETGDGNTVVAWYGTAQPRQPTLLYFHGNAGSLASRADRIAKYMAAGRGIFMMSYRSYSGSTGKPSEAANVADGMRAYEALRAQGVAATSIVIYGESIGSGVAVQVAAEKEAAGLILDAPYTSVVDLAAAQYPWLPVRPMLRDRYESVHHIAAVHMPLLVIHGENDRVIPVDMGRALLERANDPKSIVTFPGAGHADHNLFGSYDAVNNWLDRLPRGG